MADEALRPITLLQREHAIILKHLTGLEDAFRRLGDQDAMASVTGSRSAWEGVQQEVDFFTKEVSIHFKREAILFTVLAHSLGSEHNPLACVDREHHLLTSRAARLGQTLTGLQLGVLDSREKPGMDLQGVRLALTAYIALFRSHIALEEKVLFPLASIRLNDGQLSKIWDQMKNV